MHVKAFVFSFSYPRRKIAWERYTIGTCVTKIDP